MKILENKYPIGSIGNRTAGRYIDKDLYENLRLLVKKITEDMTFLGFVSSSTLEVGTGKSVFVQQLGEAWNNLLEEEHGIKRDLTLDNIVFRPEDLITESLKLPKYSVVILDEWEDAHYWSKLGMTLRQFFRKCRQLNLFMLCIIPNYFELPIGYAVSRSVFFIDVKFGENFERGFFDFYNFPTKKRLYLKGKKEHDYGKADANLKGIFEDGYVVDKELYLAKKKHDLADVDPIYSPMENKRIAFLEVFDDLVALGLTKTRVIEAFHVARDTAYKWLRERDEFKDTG